jgi:hypothetical protein
MAWNYWYAYECADSSETRGARPVGVGVKAPLTTGGCGHWNVRGTREPIYDDSTVQGSPCKNCGRRQRLNPGIVHMRERKWDAGRIRPDGTVVPEWTPAELKQHAFDEAELENLRNDPRPEGMSFNEYLTRNHSSLSESERNDRLRAFGYEQNEEEGEEE